MSNFAYPNNSSRAKVIVVYGPTRTSYKRFRANTPVLSPADEGTRVYC